MHTVIDNNSLVCYDNSVTLTQANSMSVLYNQQTKSKYRITLELETLSDFNPHDISWEKVFELQDNERCKSIIEDMSNPVSW